MRETEQPITWPKMMAFGIRMRPNLWTDSPILPTYCLCSKLGFLPSLALEDLDLVFYDPAPQPLLWPQEFETENNLHYFT
jgi:hypothetical protein